LMEQTQADPKTSNHGGSILLYDLSA
jgi:hypothetical protein